MLKHCNRSTARKRPLQTKIGDSTVWSSENVIVNLLVCSLHPKAQLPLDKVFPSCLTYRKKNYPGYCCIFHWEDYIFVWHPFLVLPKLSLGVNLRLYLHLLFFDWQKKTKPDYYSSVVTSTGTAVQPQRSTAGSQQQLMKIPWKTLQKRK